MLRNHICTCRENNNLVLSCISLCVLSISCSGVLMAHEATLFSFLQRKQKE